MLLSVAGLVAVPQHVVRDHRGFVARVDLAFPDVQLAIEYDGRWHAERTAFTKDRERLNRLQSAGWEVLTITAEMLRDPQRVVDLVRAVVARRRRALRACWRPTQPPPASQTAESARNDPEARPPERKVRETQVQPPGPSRWRAQRREGGLSGASGWTTPQG